MPTTELLLASIDEAYDKRSWHGTNLRGALRGVTMAQATFRVRPDRHNIWELMVHAAYWKYDIRRRLTGVLTGPIDTSRFPFSRTLQGSSTGWLDVPN